MLLNEYRMSEILSTMLGDFMVASASALGETIVIKYQTLDIEFPVI